MKSRLARLSAGLIMILIAGNSVYPADIPIPSGLNPGDTFRFLFLTLGTRDATSTDIADYNAFVSTAAAGYTFQGSSIMWNAIASTATVDARDNVGGFNTNVPVYLTSGTKVANDLTTGSDGLWSGTVMATPDIGIGGLPIGGGIVWTGSLSDGTKHPSLYMGSAGNVIRGNSGTSSSSWLLDLFSPNSQTYPLYGLSGSLTVPVPEPSTYILGTLAALTMAIQARRQRRTALE